MKIELRPWRLEDAKELQANANDEKVSQHLRNVFPYPYHLEDAQGFLSFTTTLDDSNTLYRAIVVDGHIAGGCSLDVQNDIKCKSAEIGYWLGAEYWNKGIGSEVVRKVCEEGFQIFDIVRIFAEVFETNAGSIKVLENNGFQFEGRLRNSIFKNGILMDSILYAKCVES